MQKPMRLLCVVLAALMIFSIIPTQSYAQENQAETTEVAETAFQLPVTPRPTLELDDNSDSSESAVFIVLLDAPDKNFDQELDRVHQEVQATKENPSGRSRAASIDEPVIVESYDFLFDGYAVEMTYEEADRLAKLDNVISVTPEIIYTIPDTWTNEEPAMFSSNDMIGSQYAWDVGYKGEGQVVAVIDSGAQVDHPDFDLTDPAKAMYPDQATAQAKITELGLPGRYYNEKIIYAYNYRELNHRILENEFASHGQHVAGTMGANGETKGVAPEAQIMVMRVFDETGSTSSTYYLKAIDDAAKMGATSINMSLGSPAGSVGRLESSVRLAIENASKAGVVINIAAGNEGQFGYTIDTPRADNPDFGVVGSPAVEPYSLAVASVENNQTLMRIIEKEDGTKISYRIESDHEPREFEGVEVVYVGYGLEADYVDKTLDGKIALISRGDITFTEKVERAADNGAIAAILFNNVEGAGFVNMGGLDGLDIMSLQIPADKADLLMDNPTVNIYTPLAESDSISKGLMSDFSNWGLTPDGDLKPEITAPGGNIYSLANDSGYTNMSGTSMATPHVAGATAVISQRLAEDYPSVSGLEKYQLMKNLMMSTATPHVDPDGHYTSVRKQGAGVLNLEGAVESDVYAYGTDSMTKIMLGDIETNFTLGASLKNLGAEALTYKSRIVVITDRVQDGRITLQSETIKEIEGPEITVPAGGVASYSQAVDISEGDAARMEAMPNGYHAEGWIFFEAQKENVPNLVIPFHGFRGEWEAVPNFEDFIYNFDLSVDRPMYFDQGAYTAIVTNYNGKDIIMGDSTEPGDELKSFDGIIGLSPNGDGFYDDARFMGVFTRNTFDGQIRVYKEDSDTPVYESYKSPSFGLKKNHHSGQEKWPFYHTNYSWRWNGLDTNYKKLRDGNYTFEFAANNDFGDKRVYSRSVPMIIDTTPPSFDLEWDETTGILTATVTDELAGIDIVQIKNADGAVIEPSKDGTYQLGADFDLSTLTIAARDKLFNSATGNVKAIVDEGQLGSIQVDVTMNDDSTLPYYSAVIKNAEGETFKPGSMIPMGTYTVILENLGSDYTAKPSKVEITLTEEEPNQTATFVLTKMKLYGYTVSVSNHDLYENPPIDYTATAEDGTVYKLLPGLLEFWYEAELPAGKYTVEAKLDEGYLITPNPFEVEVNSDYITSRVTLSSSTGGSITPVAINEEDLDLSEVTYVIENSDGSVIEPGMPLAVDTYYVYPKNLPEGVYVDPAMNVVKITEDNLDQEVIFTYRSTVGKSGSITPVLKKFDESYPDYEVEFVIKDFHGKVMENWDELPLGTYYVSMSKYPTEYFGVEEPVEVELFEDGQEEEVVITLKRSLDPAKTVSLSLWISDRAFVAGGFDVLFTGTDGKVYTFNWVRSQYPNRITLPLDTYYVTVDNVTEGTYVEETPLTYQVIGSYQSLDLTRQKGINPLLTGNVNVTVEGTDEEVLYEIRDAEGNLIPVTEGLRPGSYEVWVLSAPENMKAEVKTIPFEVVAEETTEVVIRFVSEDLGTPILSIVQPDPVTMGVGDDITPLLPEAVTVVLAGETAQAEENTQEIPVTWDTSSFSSEEAGERTLQGELVLPEGVTNPDELKATITVNVLEKAKVIGVEPVEVTIEEGTAVENAPLPETVNVELSDGTTIVVNVTWNFDSYDPETGKLTGTLDLPEGMLVENPEDIQAVATIIIEEKVDPDLEVLSVEPLESITLQGPVSFDDLQLPETIVANLQNNYRVVLDLEWIEENFDGTVAGTYPLFARLVLPEGITNPSEIMAQIEVTILIEEEPEARTIVSVETLPELEISEGSDPDKFLPKAVGVYLDNDTKVYLPVSWSLVNENAIHQAVENTYKGTIELPADGGIQNPEGLEATQLIIIREEVKPDPEIIVVPTPRPEPKPETPVVEIVLKRLFGANRYETAIKISAELARKGGTVVIASGENFPDALAGIALAEQENAPLLLSKKDDLPMETAFEIYRLGAKEAVILGGEMSIGKTVEDKVKELGLEVSRIAGATRHETAALIAKELHQSDKVILATGSNYPDALSIAVLSGSENMPLLLTDAQALTAVTKEALLDLKVKEVIIVGGNNVVSEAVEREVKALGIVTERLSGATRYETNALINARYYKNADAIVVATGENFADALTGSILAIEHDTGILFTKKHELPTASSSYLLQSSHDEVILLGGPLSISDAVEEKIIDLLK